MNTLRDQSRGKHGINRPLRFIGMAFRRATLTLVFSVSQLALGASDAERVMVVKNSRSPVSRSVAEDYATRRGVRNVISISTQDAAANVQAETMSVDAYKREVEAPVRSFLANHPLVDFIVVTKGVPIRVSSGDNHGLSLDGQLASLGYDARPDAIRVEISANDSCLGSPPGSVRLQAWANAFWNSEIPFSHTRFGGYLVTRLDGYSEADAKSLVRRSLDAERNLQAGRTAGEVLLDVVPQFGFSAATKRPYTFVPEKRVHGMKVSIVCNRDHVSDINSDLELAADRLKQRGLSVELDKSERFVGDRRHLMGYFSYGSNDPSYDPAAYHSIRFAPGALAETAVSTSARTFLPTQGGQSLIADLISQGATGVKGYTDEPLTQAIASPSIMFERYARGWTLAESLYAASALVGWRDIVIGDPLARGYSR